MIIYSLHVHYHTEYGDWDEDEIECLKEGLRKFGRAWGKIYREVGGRKTATQCKQFYDTHCAIEKLGLLKALADHSSMKVCKIKCVYCWVLVRYGKFLSGYGKTEVGFI